ncbi:peptidoglycan-binding domain-containing protein [Brasilonema bromeliae]|uniref:Peptidoglycan-binding protein n=1 Tax=Brasilonema bromeliae SPC951 TaxID=385972 RepID=A0ABX1P9R4_9CYAN|nr:peptidoglycan-binding domain-containing protein [Brasilonema bromeliae]NMG20768.1 peptidoglycan-binding protein [Brasilonema bromeliae SPC951]
MSGQALGTVNMPRLSKNSQGEAVKILQLLLDNFHGYSIAVDGIFGSNTENAVKDFQNSRDFVNDPPGVVGYQTWEALANRQ